MAMGNRTAARHRRPIFSDADIEQIAEPLRFKSNEQRAEFAAELREWIAHAFILGKPRTVPSAQSQARELESFCKTLEKAEAQLARMHPTVEEALENALAPAADLNGMIEGMNILGQIRLAVSKGQYAAARVPVESSSRKGRRKTSLELVDDITRLAEIVTKKTESNATRIFDGGEYGAFSDFVNLLISKLRPDLKTVSDRTIKRALHVWNENRQKSAPFRSIGGDSSSVR